MSEKPKPRQLIGIREFIAILVLLTVLVILTLPMLSRARESARGASCAGNLKQFGLVCHMYAKENKGYYPPRSSFLTTGSLMPDPLLLCPEYWAAPQMGLCPADLNERDERAAEWIPDASPEDLLTDVPMGGAQRVGENPELACQYYLRAWSYSYMYTDFLAWDWFMLKAPIDARNSAVHAGLVETYSIGLQGSRCGGTLDSVKYAPGFAELDKLRPNEDIPEFGRFSGAYFPGSTPYMIVAGMERIPLMRIHEGVERYTITVIDTQMASTAPYQAMIAIMWDAPSARFKTTGRSTKGWLVQNHPDFGNVLCMDGHVESRSLEVGRSSPFADPRRYNIMTPDNVGEYMSGEG